MARRIVLHIGTMKSGTSYVQASLQARADELAARGVDFLGGRFGAQAKAVNAVLRGGEGAGDRWARLVASAQEGRTGLVSMEFLSFAGPEQVSQLLDPLAGDRVEVVLTVRDQLRAVPAQWQTHVRNQGTVAWADYVREVSARRPSRGGARAHRSFHRAQDLETLLERWARHPGVASTTVVLVPGPEAPRGELLRRFSAALGADVPEPPAGTVRANESLGLESCELLRRVNLELGGRLRGKAYRQAVRPLAREALLPLRGEESRAVLDATSCAFALERNDRFRGLLAASACRVVGEPFADLPTTPPEQAPPAAPAPGEHRLGVAASTAWDFVHHRSGDPAPAPDDLDAAVAGLARRLGQA